MNVGILTTSHPRWPGDAAGAFVEGFARTVRGLGHRAEVLAPEPARGRAPPSGVRWVAYARPRALARTFYGAGAPHNAARDPRAWPGLATYPLALAGAVAARRGRWDALVSHWALPCGLVGAALRGARPHCAVLHSADVALLRRLPARGALAGALVRGSSRLWFAAEAHRAELLSWCAGATWARARAISFSHPMGIDPPARAPRAEARRALGVDGFVVATMSRLTPIKGLDHAIDAVGGAATLCVAGDGPERARLEGRARARGARVRFLGWVRGRAKARLLAAADAFLAPSVVLPSGRSEGSPTAVLEAAAAGLPIVATAVGGLPAMVGEAGLVVPPADPGALRAALELLRDDRPLRARLSAAAVELGERHRWDALAPRVAACLAAG